MYVSNHQIKMLSPYIHVPQCYVCTYSFQFQAKQRHTFRAVLMYQSKRQPNLVPRNIVTIHVAFDRENTDFDIILIRQQSGHTWSKDTQIIKQI